MDGMAKLGFLRPVKQRYEEIDLPTAPEIWVACDREWDNGYLK
tara:strand:+ start:350 stop:478 length:129 start_codon:yes stop_codon:yes gene_type:complete